MKRLDQSKTVIIECVISLQGLKGMSYVAVEIDLKKHYASYTNAQKELAYLFTKLQKDIEDNFGFNLKRAESAPMVTLTYNGLIRNTYGEEHEYKLTSTTIEGLYKQVRKNLFGEHDEHIFDYFKEFTF